MLIFTIQLMCFSSLLLLPVKNAKNLYLSQKNEIINKYIGENMFVDCGVLPEASGKEFKWKFSNSSNVPNVGVKVYAETNYDLSSGDCAVDNCVTLYLINIQKEMEGTYTCEAVINDVKESKDIVVRTFREIGFQNTPKFQNFSQGQEGFVKCYVSGTPQPSVSWRYKGKRIFSNEKYHIEKDGLKIQNLTEEDVGKYICRASIRGETPSTKSFEINVNVYYPASILNTEQGIIKSYLGSKVNLTCITTGLPKPNVTWFKENTEIYPTDPTVFFYSLENGTNIAEVMIVGTQDLVNYHCRASNGIGISAEITFKIEMADLPGEIVQIDIFGEGNNLRLTIEEPYDDGGADITGYLVKYRFRGDTEWNYANETLLSVNNKPYILKDLTENRNFEIMVYAKNPIGMGPGYMAEGQTGEMDRDAASTRTSAFLTITLLLFTYHVIVP